MSTQRVQGLAGLQRALERDLGKKLRRDVIAAVARAAVATAHEVVQNVPIAFGELRGSVHVDASGAAEGNIHLVADAPHAAAVEVGSRPHVVPIADLVKWVRLRGLQGLSKGRKPGSTTAATSRRVAEDLGKMAASRGGAGGGVNATTDVLSLAKAIQFAIAKRGTKPTWFMRRQLPFARRAVDAEIRAALRRSAEG